MKITLLRLLLIPVFCFCIYRYTPDSVVLRYAAVVVFAVAAASDSLDGYIARKYNQRTALGTRLDPTADKLMVNLGFIFLAANPALDPALPKWFPVFILGRDAVMVLGAFLIQKVYTAVQIVPRTAGKANTFFQIVCMVAFLIQAPFAPWVMMTTVGAGVVSLLDYMAVGIAQARERAHAQAAPEGAEKTVAS